jgi:hypothetical protein
MMMIIIIMQEACFCDNSDSNNYTNKTKNCQLVSYFPLKHKNVYFCFW